MSAGTALRDALATRARSDLALLALAVAGLAALSLGDVLVALPQGLAAAAVLVAGARAERLRLPLPGRILLLAAAAAWAWLPAGEPPAILARFLSGVAAASLLRPKEPREHGFAILLFLLETALAAALSLHWGVAPAGLLLAVLFHRAVGSWHRQRSAARAAAGGGPLVRVEDPRRLRRSADRAALTAILVAGPIFLVLPRTDLPRFAARGGGGEPGVGEEMRLGPLGSLSDADQVVGRVAPQDAEARDAETYFRSVVLESFDGTRWFPSETEPSPRSRYDPVAGVVSLGVSGAGAPAWLFVVEASAAPRLPLPERASTVTFRDPLPSRVRIDAAETLRPAMDRPMLRWVYEAKGTTKGRDRRRTLPPSEATLVRGPAALRSELAPAVAAVLRERPDASARERAGLLADWVRSAATYDLVGGPGGRNPVGDFLFRAKRGHCEHFASALAMALREARVPSRVVAGYHASRWNEVGGFWVLRRRDAHAWVEAWIEGEGWVRFDATPAAAREADPYEGLSGFLARLRDAAAFAWSKAVLGYDHEAQRDAIESLRDAISDAAPAARRAASFAAAIAGAGGLLVLGLLASRRRRRSRRVLPGGLGGGFYGEALRILRRQGFERRGAETPAELAARAAPRLSPPAAQALDAITAAFARTRYGGSPPPAREVVEGWVALLSRSGRPWTAARVGGE